MLRQKKLIERILTLESSNYRLNLLSNSDKVVFLECYRDDSLTKFIGGRLSEKDAQESFELSLVANQKKNKRITWAIESKRLKEKVGICALVLTKVSSSEAYLGAIILDKHQGQKAAQEALSAIVSYGFEHLGLTSVLGYSELKNYKSEMLMKSLGFNFRSIEEGEKAGFYWEITKDEWSINKSGEIE